MTAVIMMIKRVIFFAAMLAAAGAVFAQSVSLEAEIQNIEKVAGRQGVAPEERHNALVRLARLRQLSGDIEGAAKSWLEAAAAVPGKVDDDALLSCAYCLAAMGEWDRAAAALEPLLFKSPRARFLDAGIKAVKTGNTSALAAMADNFEYSQMKSEIYFMLWKISAAEIWRQRLLAEFPGSPECRMVSGAASAVVIKPSPFLLFIGGLDSLPIIRTETAVVTSPPAGKPASPAPVPQTESVKLQTGLFGQKANAEAQIDKLKKAGFPASLENRTGNSGEMWVVTVPAGPDTNRSIRELKSAGFDSFPLR